MKNILTLPVSDDDIKALRVGDIFYITGTITTGRDDVHARVVFEGMDSPVDLRGGAIFHAGPIVRESPEENELISVGPTSSIRMESTSPEFLRRTGAKIMIGKGGMGPRTSAACKELCAIHCIFPGGCAVSAATMVERIVDVQWRELGMPECMWVMRVKEFGPLIVTIDSTGADMFADVKRTAAMRSESACAHIAQLVKGWQSVS